MKRSTKILTTTMLTGLVFGLSACSTQEQVLNFSSTEQCQQERPLEVPIPEWTEICDTAFERAEARHLTEAPRYALSGDGGDDLCEEVHGDGRCYQYTDEAGNSWFVPFMAGYFIHSALNNGVRSYGYSQSRPLYHSASGGYTNGTFSYRTNGLNGATSVRGNPTRYEAPQAPRTYSNSAAVRSSGGFGAGRTGGSFGG